MGSLKQYVYPDKKEKTYKGDLREFTSAHRIYYKLIYLYNNSKRPKEEFSFQTSNDWFCHNLKIGESNIRYGLKVLLKKGFLKIEKINRRYYVISILKFSSNLKDKFKEVA